jgi:hypothetical protein
MRVPAEELQGKCLFNEKIRGRIADLTVDAQKAIRVRSYNRLECPLPNGKPEEVFDEERFWQWVEQANYKVVDPITYVLNGLSAEKQALAKAALAAAAEVAEPLKGRN